MNVDIPSLVKAAVPESEGKNARIISQSGSNYRDPGFLSKDFPHSPPKLYLTAETDDFDELTLAEWRDEGFNVEYVPLGDDRAEYRRKLQALAKKDMGPCETFGIIAYGEAATLCLEHYHVIDNNPEFKLGLLIAYYPTAIPDPQGRFPSSIKALVHLAAGEEIGVIKQTQMIGIQGKRRITRKKVENGKGTGGTLLLAYPSYTYDAEPGFAEHDMDEYDNVSADLAWSRSLATANRAFSKEAELELAVEENVHGRFFARNTGQVLSTFTTQKSPHVTHIPTLTGGIGAAELERFYSRFFSNPPSIRLTLLSRTIGADRVVDEIHVKFKHTHEMPWILPGVPPTNKRVEVLVVSIFTLKGGKICHEHVYWDQASVLLQVGLLEVKMGPVTAKKTGVKRLPVVGREAARRLIDGWDSEEEGEADNELIPGWDDDPAADGGEEAGEGESDAEEEQKRPAKGKSSAGQKSKNEPSQQRSGHQNGGASRSKEAAKG